MTKLRNFRMFLLIIVAFALVALPIAPVMVDAATYSTVEEAESYIESQQEIADKANESIDTASDYIVQETVPAYATFWALIPPIAAIALALITKEVYFSLFFGILAGALLYANFNFEQMMNTIFVSGMMSKLGEQSNIGILMFLVLLGMLVSLMNKAGGSAAYGRWASQKIKSRNGALLSTLGLGILIFVDDYFNCLTVGSVMRPVTDKFKISRAKLAYLIDSTAAPVCILVPISSWAAAVSGVVDNTDGLTLFIQAIPYNFYALLTLVMIFTITILKFDFGPMKRHEINAFHGDLYTTDARPYASMEQQEVVGKGTVLDLVLPVIVLIISCVCGMIYTGGFFSGVSFVDAFARCDASIGLVYGSFVAIFITFVLYMVRRVLTFGEFMEALSEGFRAMVPAILILIFAWTLGNVTNMLGADVFVKNIVQQQATVLHLFLPAIVFLIGIGLAFSTGTSWGTFGILLPIVVNVLEPGSELLIISISACLAGAVCGDHISPISDTTIMASTGAQCDHINHVSTQLPYALLVAGVSFFGYILAAFVQNAWIALPITIVVLIGILYAMKVFFGDMNTDVNEVK